MIKRLYNKKVLGLGIDHKLQWTKHIEELSKKDFQCYSYPTKDKISRTARNIKDDVQVICTSLFYLLLNYMVRLQ